MHHTAHREPHLKIVGSISLATFWSINRRYYRIIRHYPTQPIHILMLVLMLAFAKIPAGLKYAGEKHAALDAAQRTLDALPGKIEAIKDMSFVEWCDAAHKNAQKRHPGSSPASEQGYEQDYSRSDGKDWSKEGVEYRDAIIQQVGLACQHFVPAELNKRGTVRKEQDQ